MKLTVKRLKKIVREVLEGTEQTSEGLGSGVDRYDMERMGQEVNYSEYSIDGLIDVMSRLKRGTPEHDKVVQALKNKASGNK